MKNTFLKIFYILPSYILTGLLTILSGIDTLSAFSQEIPLLALKDSAIIHFRQSHTDLLPDFQDNEEHLNQMMSHLQKYAHSDSALRFSRIHVVGAASPEGSTTVNRRLSEKRAERIFNWFATRTQFPDSIMSFEFIGRDWKGLRHLVEQDVNVPDRENVLIALDEIIASIGRADGDSEANLKRIKGLGNGKPYQYMYANLFPQLRYSRLYVDYSFLYPERIYLPEMSLTPPDITASPQGEVNYPESLYRLGSVCHPFYMGLKTNLLYDALALPSIGAEFYVGKNWSIVGNWTYGWWDKDKSHRYWRAYGGDIAVRKWFGNEANKKPLTGHHLGVYAGVVTYDFEFGGKGYMGGLPDKTLWDRCNYMAGIEYGYSLPIARRLNLDFTIGIGYLGGKVIEYIPKDEIYIWQKTKNFNWVGPTKAEISLVWLIGCDNYNRKFNGRKGGNL